MLNLGILLSNFEHCKMMVNADEKNIELMSYIDDVTNVESISKSLDFVRVISDGVIKGRYIARQPNANKNVERQLEQQMQSGYYLYHVDLLDGDFSLIHFDDEGIMLEQYSKLSRDLDLDTEYLTYAEVQC